MGLHRLGVLLKPLNDLILGSASFVRSWGVLLSLFVEFQSGVSLDFNSLGLVHGRVELGNFDSLDVFELFCDFFPGGCEGFAVAAPRGVEFDQNVVIGLDDFFLEGLSDEHVDGALLGLDDRLGFQERGQVSGLEVGDELLDRLGGKRFDFSLEGVLHHSVGGVQNPDGGEHICSNADEFSEAALDSVFNIRFDEDDLALKCVSSFLESSSIPRFLSVLSEKNDSLFPLAEDAFDRVFGEFLQDWDGRCGDPLCGGVREVGGVEDFLVELSENGQTGESGTETGRAFGAVGSQELEFLGELTRSKRVEGGERFSGEVTEVDEGELVGFTSGFNLITGCGFVGWAYLLENPIGDLWLLSSTGEFNLLLMLEEEKSWETLDAEPLGKFVIGSRVHLGDVV